MTQNINGMDNRLRSRFDKNTLSYLLGLFVLAVGLGWKYGIPQSLIVVGSIQTCVSIATSFFVTWLSTKVKEK